MKWLFEEDFGIVTGFLFGLFIVSGIFTLFFFQNFTFIPFLILAIWVYSVLKRNKIEKQQNNSV